MNSTPLATEPAAESFQDYRLTDELAQFCLPAASLDANRKYAWANSICFLFLVIGLVGMKPPKLEIRQVEPMEESVVEVVEPPPQQQPTPTETVPEETPNPETTDAPNIVQTVVADSPQVQFSVPIKGGILAPMKAAQAPQINATVVAQPKAQPQIREFVGSTGRYPDPLFIQNLIPNGAEAMTVVEFSVDQGGKLTSIEVKERSGYPAWDKQVIETIKRKWAFTPADAGSWRYIYVMKVQ
jgi:TonB family protein